MFLHLGLLLSAAASSPREEGPAFEQVLASFDGVGPTGGWHWRLTNDPVMGGLSSSTWTVENGVAVWDGTVEIVPSLQAPGFCTAATRDGMGITARFPDVSAFSHMLLRVRSTTPAYPGFKISFAANTLLPQFKSFKSNFTLAPTTDWQIVAIPFRPAFSNDWSPYDGECGTTDPGGTHHSCCSKAHQEVCVTLRNLRSISQIGVWAEGRAGAFNLVIDRIGAGNVALSVS